MESNCCGSSTNGSTATVRGRRFHGRFSSNGTGTVLPRKVVGRRQRDEERELVDRPLSWWGGKGCGWRWDMGRNSGNKGNKGG